MITPHPKQAQLLACPAHEVLFGGARGPGKSMGILLDYANQFQTHGKLAIGALFRETYPELADMERKGQEVLGPMGFEYTKQDPKAFTHPCGAQLSLGYARVVEDVATRQGHEYTWIGYDDAGNLRSLEVLYRLRATLRNPHGIPKRMVISANPGGRAHDELKERYMGVPPYDIQTDANGWSRCYIPGVFSDNPTLAETDPHYIEQITSDLPEYLAQAWRDGDWDIQTEPGMFFRHEDLPICEKAPILRQVVRSWDRAASEPSDRYPDPDWTVGVKLGIKDGGDIYVLDVIRVRRRSAAVRALIRDTAELDGVECKVVTIQDPGAAGKGEADDMRRDLVGYNHRVRAETGKKHIRWQPFASAAQNGQVHLVRGAWNKEFRSELVQLTDNERDYRHDDQADAASAAFREVTARGHRAPARGRYR